MAEKKEKKYVSDDARLMAEWDFEKNEELGFDPNKVTCSSGRKVWWKCKSGHEWEARVADINQGKGCPYCSGRYAIIGETDLQTVNPILATEWNYEKNIGLTPQGVMPNSNKKTWWICGKGHEWQATVYHRNKGQGCPICNSERHTSFPEYAIVYYLEKYGFEVIHSYRGHGYELDIYIPSKKIAIEYDGYLWHKNKTEQDLNKNLKCEKDGIKLYRIREGLPLLNDSSVDFFVQKSQKNLSVILKEILSEITGTIVDVDLNRDMIEIEELRVYTEKATSLLILNPMLAREWNYEKNGNLKPENCTFSSGKKVWWICGKGHEWKATISHRNSGRGCPYCSGKKVLIGYNDLKTINPSLAKEWNYEKNGNLKSENFTANSGKKVWWKCQKGHEWQTTIDHRNKGRGCPYCLGRYAIRGKNDLQTVNPTLAYEWDYEKNVGLTPMDVLPNSGKKVWWKCSKGHEWQAIIQSRNKGNGCPFCARKKKRK